MRLSKYAKTYAYGKNRVILWSCLTTAAAAVDKAVLTGIKKGNLPENEERTLAELGFITGDLEKEREIAHRFIENSNNAKKRLNILAVLNLDCNLACKYCFEKDIKGMFYMGDDTAGRLLEFISSRLSDKKELAISFYGGEPLLGLGLLKRLARDAGRIAREKGVEFGFTLVTNGTMLTRKVVDELVPLGLRGAKVTLDGPKDTHDLYRPFKSGRGSFDSIFKNMMYASRKIKIGVGGNFDKQSFRRFPALLDYMLDKGLTPGRIHSVKFDPIVEAGYFCNAGACEFLLEKWFIRASVMLRKEILKRGFKTADIKPSACSIHSKDFFVVNHDGGLYKCPAFLGNERFRTGSLAEGITEYEAMYDLGAWKNKKCLNCEYLPLCYGGCKYIRFLRTGGAGGVECKKEFLDKVLESFVKQEIKNLPQN